MLVVLYQTQPHARMPWNSLTCLDFGLAQIYPLTEEESNTESKVISASFSDPYILLVRDDSTVTILTSDESGDLDEVERGEHLKKGKWPSGSLYEDANDSLRLEYGDDSEDEAGNTLMFLLSSAGGLQVCQVPSSV